MSGASLFAHLSPFHFLAFSFCGGAFKLKCFALLLQPHKIHYCNGEQLTCQASEMWMHNRIHKQASGPLSSRCGPGELSGALNWAYTLERCSLARPNISRSANFSPWKIAGVSACCEFLHTRLISDTQHTHTYEQFWQKQKGNLVFVCLFLPKLMRHTKSYLHHLISNYK